jgi:predicted DNA-binding helix-hairpin-helix protein
MKGVPIAKKKQLIKVKYKPPRASSPMLRGKQNIFQVSLVRRPLRVRSFKFIIHVQGRSQMGHRQRPNGAKSQVKQNQMVLKRCSGTTELLTQKALRLLAAHQSPIDVKKERKAASNLANSRK